MAVDAPSARPGAVEGRSFTLRGVLAGLAIGLVICFSNSTLRRNSRAYVSHQAPKAGRVLT